ncbi:MAG: inner nuclear membrane protein enriched at telomere/subtelomere region [Stictis urceolatum]|nr:inner nuclear membrane protein enriched at telomere/subtelomere region [Stictis urceolata]
MSSLLAYAKFTFRKKLSDKARVPALVASTLDRLATQAALHAQGSTPEPFISMGQMRDDVLRDEFSIKRRDDIWNRVKQVVEMNTNVRANVKENRYGEISRQWEWIGGLPTVEDGWSGDRRQSGRHSMGPRITPESKPTPVRDGTPMEARHWDEGRPIY